MANLKRPVLRYHGGKWRLAPWICSHLPPHAVYVEPFGGAASVLMRKPRSYAEVYNDLDGEIVNLFHVLRSSKASEELAEMLRLTPFARDEFNRAYDSAVATPVERPRRTVILAFMSKGSAGSTARNLDGSRNKDGFRKYCRAGTHGPHPPREWGTFPAEIAAMTERLQGVVIENIAAADLIQQHDAESSLFYCDPPYPASTRGIDHGPRYTHEMTDSDHRDLAAVLRAVKGMVVLSGYPHMLYDEELYPDWQRVLKAAMADGARKRTEVLWMNRSAVERANGRLDL